MRLIRIGEPRSRVADDIRAGLTALGRGDTVVGGIALVDLTPHGCAAPIDAVLLSPYGVLIVVGVDLPGPTMRLEAPLHAQWKADGWPLVGSGTAVNPASGMLASADQLAQRLLEVTNGSLRLGVILAVGPYVDSATIPDAGPDGAVRALFPTPNRLREAITELLPDTTVPLTVAQARAILRAIEPETPIQPDGLLKQEGFLDGPGGGSWQQGEVTMNLPALSSVPAVGSPAARRLPPQPADRESGKKKRRSSRARWFPITAIALLLAVLMAAIAAAAGESDADAGSEEKPPIRHAITGVRFTQVAAKQDPSCEQNAFGDVQASLERVPCSGMHLGSYLAELNGKRAAVSIAVIRFATSEQAAQLKRLADTPGTGGTVDLASETGDWSDEEPNFDNATYRSEATGGKVRIVRAAWLDDITQPHDKLLARIAETAYQVPVDG